MEDEYKDFDNMDDFLVDLFKNPETLGGYMSLFFGRLKHIILEIKTKIRHAWQRVFRGWDDSVVWSIDSYLSEMLPIWLQELKKQHRGIPARYFLDENDQDFDGARSRWFADIDVVIAGFDAMRKLITMDYEWETVEDLHRAEEEMQDTFEIGMKKLTEIWSTLWW